VSIHVWYASWGCEYRYRGCEYRYRGELACIDATNGNSDEYTKRLIDHGKDAEDIAYTALEHTVYSL